MRHTVIGQLVTAAVLSLSGCQPRPFRVPDPYSQPQAARPMAVEGVILSVERPRPDDSQTYVSLVVAPGDDKKPIRLLLAPGWYLDEQGLRFAPNESVRVEGRQDPSGDGESIVVRRIWHGARDHELRDVNDHPRWQAPSD